jgi:hypothetical protein
MDCSYDSPREGQSDSNGRILIDLIGRERRVREDDSARAAVGCLAGLPQVLLLVEAWHGRQAAQARLAF